jgi:hypothetical protein
MGAGRILSHTLTALGDGDSCVVSPGAPELVLHANGKQMSFRSQGKNPRC